MRAMIRSISTVAVLVAGLALPLASAEAAFTITLSEVGSDVVGVGTGTLDLTDLTYLGTVTRQPYLAATSTHFGAQGFLELGPVATASQDYYGSVNGPGLTFGTGALAYPTSGSGDYVGILSNKYLYVSQGYVSGDQLSDTSTWGGASFASLGLTPGTYVNTWGTGATADSFTIQVGAAAPIAEPGSLALLGAGVIGLVGLRRRRV